MSSYVRRKTPGNTDWFVHDRFGMFIHFGLYAMPARHEWIKKMERIPDKTYDRYFENFNPDMFDAREWAKAAKNAGMKYAVLTVKHHEGFCLFDTKYTDYKITNTPFGRDLVREYVDAFRAEGLEIGFYYSLIDWHHPDFPIDVNHPRARDLDAEEEDKNRDMKKYAQYMRDQITELLTNYGKIRILWFDFSYPDVKKDSCYKPWMQFGGGKGKDEWEAEKLIATARALQPWLIIDNRTGIEQDISTPEQYQILEWPRNEDGTYRTWEACQTFSGSWGYYRDEQTWKSPRMLLEMLIKTVSLGGNLLMNVGPCARGYFDSRAMNALDAFGKWMKYNSRSIYGCTMAEPEFKAPEGTLLTQSEDGNRLYIHLLTYPFETLTMENLGEKIRYAQFLNDASEVRYNIGKKPPVAGEDFGTVDAETVIFKLPAVKPDTEIPVIEILLK